MREEQISSDKLNSDITVNGQKCRDLSIDDDKKQLKTAINKYVLRFKLKQGRK